VTIGGQRETATVNQASFDLRAGAAVFSLVHDHEFRLVVRAIGTSSGASDCEEGYSQSAQSRAAVGSAIVFYFIPIPWVTGVDEASYWTDTAIRAGQRTAWCFVTPSSQAGGRNDSKTAGDAQYDDDWR